MSAISSLLILASLSFVLVIRCNGATETELSKIEKGHEIRNHLDGHSEAQASKVMVHDGLEMISHGAPRHRRSDRFHGAFSAVRGKRGKLSFHAMRGRRGNWLEDDDEDRSSEEEIIALAPVALETVQSENIDSKSLGSAVPSSRLMKHGDSHLSGTSLSKNGHATDQEDFLRDLLEYSRDSRIRKRFNPSAGTFSAVRG